MKKTTLATLIGSIGALAQAQPLTPAGNTVRYTPVTGESSALTPRRDEPAVAADRTVVARLVVEADRDAVPADGQSPVVLTIRLHGADGKLLNTRVEATVEVTGGRLRELPAAGSHTPPTISIERGQARLTLLAPHMPQDVRLRVSAGGQSVTGTISFVPDLQPMVAAGLVEGIVNLRQRTVVQPVRPNDGFEQEIRAWSREFGHGRGSAAARAAFFLKGTVRGDLLLTAAYDSDKETRARLLRDIHPDAVYPVYGDASLRSVDAKSGSRLYLRLDSGKSYLLWGDFVTGDGFAQRIGQGGTASLQQRSLGAYNRTATGLKLHHEAGGAVVNAFVVNDSLRQVVEEFASQGSGPYGLRNSAVLEGSEKLEVIVRDRAQPSRIVRVTPLVRLVDYSFEPFSGRILLNPFLPAVDADLNPVSLRVSYEVDQGGDRFWVGGVDGQLKLGGSLEIGGSVVADRNPLAGYRLGSANATLKLGERSALVIEVARSVTEVNTNPSNPAATPGFAGRSGDVGGHAWRVELSHEGQGSQARLFAGRSDASFHNPAAPITGGRGELHASGRLDLAEGFALTGQALKSEDRAPGSGEQSLGEIGLRWSPERASRGLTLEAGLRTRRETVGTRGNSVSSIPFGSPVGLSSAIGSGAAGGALGYGQQALDPASGLPVVNPDGGLPAASSPLPAGTRLDSDSVRLGLGWRASDRLGLGAEVEHEIEGDERRRVAAGVDYRVGERTRAYARWERQSGWTQQQGVSANHSRAGALVLGVDSTAWHETQVFSEYRLRDAVSGSDARFASGLRRAWRFGNGIGLAGGVERVQVLKGSSATASAVHLGLDYTGSELWRGSTRLEVRRSADLPATLAIDEGFTTTLWTAMAARKLSREWTLLARHHHLHTDYRGRGDVTQDRSIAGLAWRNTDSNRSNALARIEFKRERDASNAAVGELSTRATIVSLHADHHPSRPWWMSGRVAAKWQTDRLELGTTGSFRAQLAAARLTWDFGKRWDLGLAASLQTGQQGARQHAVGVELGYLLAENLWLSAGYNASGYRADRDLAGSDYTQRGAYIRLRFKFDETLFKRGDREVNRSLDR